MIALVADKQAEIAALCRRYGVRRLELFGSAATGDFAPATSDLDFIIDFTDYDATVARRFHAFDEALEQLFDRPVDFIFDRKLTNPYLRATVNQSRELLYAEGPQHQRTTA